MCLELSSYVWPAFVHGTLQLYRTELYTETQSIDISDLIIISMPMHLSVLVLQLCANIGQSIHYCHACAKQKKENIVNWNFLEHTNIYYTE